MAVETVVKAGVKVVLSGYIGPKALEALQAVGLGTVQDMDNCTVEDVIAEFEAGRLTVLFPEGK